MMKSIISIPLTCLFTQTISQSSSVFISQFIEHIPFNMTFSAVYDQSIDAMVLSASGPADRWFSIGYGSSVMSGAYTIVSYPDGLIEERILGDHAEGEALPNSLIPIDQQSNQETNIVNWMVIKPVDPSDQSSPFSAINSESLEMPVILALGESDTLGYHGSQKTNEHVLFYFEQVIEATGGPAPPPVESQNTDFPTPIFIDDPSLSPSSNSEPPLLPSIAPSEFPSFDFTADPTFPEFVDTLDPNAPPTQGPIFFDFPTLAPFSQSSNSQPPSGSQSNPPSFPVFQPPSLSPTIFRQSLPPNPTTVPIVADTAAPSRIPSNQPTIPVNPTQNPTGSPLTSVTVTPPTNTQTSSPEVSPASSTTAAPITFFQGSSSSSSLSEDITLNITVSVDTQRESMTLIVDMNKDDRWFAVGLDGTTMQDTYAVVISSDVVPLMIMHERILGANSAGQRVTTDSWSELSVISSDGTIRFYGEMDLGSSDETNMIDMDQLQINEDRTQMTMALLWAHGTGEGSTGLSYHGSSNRGAVTLTLEGVMDQLRVTQEPGDNEDPDESGSNGLSIQTMMALCIFLLGYLF